MVAIREQPMAKREYVVRDSANHAYTIAFMGPYADSKIYPPGFYYFRKVKVFRHILTVWPSAMVAPAPPSEKKNDIIDTARRLD